VRTAQINGTVTGGSITQVPEAGEFALGAPAAGTIASANQVDDWSFFGRAGEPVDIFLHTGSGGTPAPVQPPLNYGQVTLIDPNGNTVAVAANSQSGTDATIMNQVLPVDGSYQVEVQAAPNTGSTGSYVLTAYGATITTSAMEINQTQNGQIESPYATDQWTFSAAANTQVQFNLVSAQSPSIQFSLTGPNGFTGFTNLTASSGLVTLPASGTYTLSVITGGAGIGAYAFQLQQTAQTSLALGTPYQGTMGGSGGAELFVLNVPTLGPLVATLQDPDTSDQNELYLSYGSAPTRSDYQYRSSNLAAANQQVIVPSASPGTWYILLYGASAPSGSTYTLTADAGSFLFGVSPSRGGTSSDSVLTLTGTGFNSQTTVNLVAADRTDYAISNVAEVSSTEITATIPANSVPAGVYSVSITQPGGAISSLADAFTMAQGGQAVLSTKVIVPNPLGNATPGVIYVQYSNTGDASMPAPLLVLSVTNAIGQQGAILTLNPALQFTGPEILRASEPPGYSTSVEILASGAVAGVLQPGESETVPVYYAGWLTTVPNFQYYSPYTFTLGALQASNTSPIDWSSLESSSQPPDVSSTAWSAIFSNLETSTGLTWGDYVQYLDSEAQYLGTLGEDVTDVSQLYSFEIQQADGLSPITQLGASVDASMPTPGSLSLSFGRFLTPSITGRNTMGPLGMGWSDNWQTSLAVQSDGTVVVTEPGGVQRLFQPVLSFSSPTGSYAAQPGDYGVLTSMGGGTFTLTEQDGTITAYNANGTLNYVQDTEGNRITAGYSNGLLTSLTASSGQSLTIAYNAAGLISSVTDSAGRETTYQYDPTDTYLTSVTTFNGQTTSYTYNTSSNIETENALLSIAYPDGTHSYFTYDAEGRFASASADGGAGMTTFTYGPGGAVASTDALGNTTTDDFDYRGLIVKVTDPLGNSTEYTYDSNDSLTQITDPAGQVTTNQYDSNGNLISTTDPLGRTTKFTYTSNFDNLASVTDANGNTTQYAYDGSGDLTSTTYADGTIASLAYDPVGNVISSTDQNGQVMSYTYNAAGQVLTKTYADGTVDSFTYDAHGDLTSTTDPTGTTTLTYNAAEELTQITYPSGLYLKYTYDAAGRRIQMVDQDGFTVNYSYDSVGRLSELTDASGNLIVKYTYDAAGYLVRQDDGNGTYTTYTYDADGNVLDLVNYAPDGSINSSFIYTYNNLGLETNETTLDGTWTYTYDAIGELTHAVFVSTNPSVPSQDETYNYDAVGNRTSTVINGVTTVYTTNNMNQYTQVGGTTYTYDPNGNMTSATDASGRTTYAYDQDNQLVGVTTPDGSDTTYVYDALGHQVSYMQNGQQVNDLIDPSGLGNIVGQFDASNNLIANYTYGVGLVSQTNSHSAVLYYGFDMLGSVVSLTDSTGVVLVRYAYEPFGEVIGSEGSATSPFTFVGQEGVLASPNGYLMGARGYDTALGRFLSHDPIGIAGYENLYCYAANEPTSNVDPSGEAWFGAGPLQNVGNSGIDIFAPTLLTPVTPGLNHEQVFFSHPVYISALASTPCKGWVTNVGFGADGHLFTFYDGNPVLQKYVQNDPLTYNDENLAAIIDQWAWETGHDKYNFWGQQCQDAAEAWRSRYLSEYGIIEPITNAFNRSLGLPSSSGLFGGGSFGGAGGGGDYTVDSVNSIDPNSLTGPAGYGPSDFVAPYTVFPYQIDFENAPTATAPAQRVVISDPLDPNLDWSTLQLTGIGFGDTNIVIPPDSQYYATTVPMTENGESFVVEITISLNPATGLLTAVFQSIDPNTQLPPDVLTGFLPPEDGTGRGMGYISFIIDPKSGLPTGTQIRNVALITFDANPAIATDQVNDEDPTQGVDSSKQALNTIDAGPPTSSVGPLPPEETSTSFTVTWSGQDDPGGSGIAFYNIYVSDDGGPFTLWQSDTTATSATFTGEYGNSYSFYSVATDNVGNVEATPSTAQATTEVLPPLAIGSISPIVPNPLNTPVSSVTVTLSEPAGGDGFTASALALTDNGVPIPITSAVSISLVSGSTYTISGLAALTTAEGNYTLTVNAAAINDQYGNPGTGSVSTSWLMDTTPPTSSVNLLPANTTSTSFTVSVTANDPNGANGSTPSGVASIAIYDSTNGGPFALFTTVTPSNPSAALTGQVGDTYGFYSIATDNAGNVQPTPTAAQATTTIASTSVDTSTLLQSSEDPAKLGDTVTFTATVSPTQGNATPTGSVQFSIDGTAIGNPVPLDGSGDATFTTSSLNVGSHTVTASYINTNGNFNDSSATLAGGQNVTTADTTVSVASNAPTSVYGQSVNLTVTVSAVTAGLPTPTGTVEFFDGSTELTSATLNGSGGASFSTAGLAVGTHNITAQYFGDENFSGNTSPTAVQTVSPAGTNTALTASPAGPVYGQSVTFTATIGVVAPGAGTPTGIVTFLDGSTTLGTASLSSTGTASYSTSRLTVGTQSITAVYGGDGNFSGSFSAATSETVSPASTNTSLSVSPSSTTYGQSVTLTASIAVVSPGVGTPTGSVEFFDGTTAIATVPLNGTTAAFNTSALAVGTQSITAQYLGDCNFSGSTSSAVGETVSQAGTTTTLASLVNSTVYGQQVTLTATIGVIAPGAGTPTGTVTFLDGSSTIGTGPLNSNGTASFTTAALAVGNHSITAVYSGDSNFSGSTSATVAQTVGKDGSTAVISSSANPSLLNQSVSFTVTVSAAVPGSGTPTGTVQFSIDGSKFGPAVALAGGSATSGSISALKIGNHSITASYSGDGNFTASTAPSLTQVVNQDNTTTNLVVTVKPSVYGQSISFTASVAAVAPGTGAPAGSVTFFDGSTTLKTVTLTAGAATYTTTKLATGQHAITAAYNGSSTFAISTSAALTQTVNQDGTSTVVTASANPSVYGQSVTFTATVSAAAPGSGTPTGSVTFMDGSTSLGSGTLDCSGRATISTRTLTVGSQSITASYGGDSNFITSTSPTLNQAVNQDGTSTALSSSVYPSVYGQSVTFTATVSAAVPGSGTPTGSVTFMDGSTALGSATLSSGKANFKTTSLVVGSQAITAVYGGDGNFITSTSAALTQTVQKDATATKLTSSVNPSVFGQSVTFTATVQAASPGSGTPSGTVTFYDGSTAIGTGTLGLGNPDTATFTKASLTVGAHAITAVYGGDGNFSTSTSTAINQGVNQAGSSTTVVSSANPSSSGQAVTFTASVSAVSPGSGTPTGTVTFYDGSTTLGTASLNGTGTASFITSSLSVGSHSIKVSYGGGGDFKASTSAVLKQVVQAAASSNVAIASVNSPNAQAITVLQDDSSADLLLYDQALEQVSAQSRPAIRRLRA